MLELFLSAIVSFPILVLTPWRWFKVIAAIGAGTLGCGWIWFDGLGPLGESVGRGVIFVLWWLVVASGSYACGVLIRLLGRAHAAFSGER